MQFAKLRGDLDARQELGTAVLGLWFSDFQVSEPTWRLGSRVRPKFSGDEGAAGQGRTLEKQRTKERQGPVRLETWSPPRYAATLGTWGRYCARFPGLILPFFLPTEIRFVGGSNVLNEQNYIFQPP